MPVLTKETSVFPETLFDSFESPSADNQWMVLYTKPRQEKSVARDLLRREVPFYLPLVKKTLQYGRRRISSYAPLFDGYVFILGSEAQRVFSLMTNRVLRVLPAIDGGQLFADLRQIEQLIRANVPLTIESRLQAGMTVQSQRSLAGVEGTILCGRRDPALGTLISCKRGAVEIEDFLLERLS